MQERNGLCVDLDRSEFTFPIFEYCHPDYYSDKDSERDFVGDVDVCGDRLITGHSVIGKLLHVGKGNAVRDCTKLPAHKSGAAVSWNSRMIYVTVVDLCALAVGWLGGRSLQLSRKASEKLAFDRNSNSYSNYIRSRIFYCTYEACSCS